MVRLERIIYEKLVNSSAMQRARKITKPTSWNNKRTDNLQYSLLYWPFGNLLSKIFSPLIEKFTSMEYKVIHDISKEQGIPVQTFFAMNESSWRRDMDVEHIKRENIHPWNLLEENVKRCRFWKVSKYMDGYHSPDYILDQTHGKAFVEDKEMAEVFESLFDQYNAEKMPVIYQFRSRKVVLDALILHNASDTKTYNRYFYNEAYYTPEFDKFENEEKGFDLTDPSEQNKFKVWMEDKIKKYPGIFTPEGQEFNYEGFFRNAELFLSNKENKGLYSDSDKQTLNNQNDEEILESKNTVGINMPKEVSGQKYRAWMA